MFPVSVEEALSVGVVAVCLESVGSGSRVVVSIV